MSMPSFEISEDAQYFIRAVIVNYSIIFIYNILIINYNKKYR